MTFKDFLGLPREAGRRGVGRTVGMGGTGGRLGRGGDSRPYDWHRRGAYYRHRSGNSTHLDHMILLEYTMILLGCKRF